MCSVGFMGGSGQNPSPLLLWGRRLCVAGTAGMLLLSASSCPLLGKAGLWLAALPAKHPCTLWVFSSCELRVGGMEILVWSHGFLVTTSTGGFLHHHLGLEGPFQTWESTPCHLYNPAIAPKIVHHGIGVKLSLWHAEPQRVVCLKAENMKPRKRG